MLGFSKPVRLPENEKAALFEDSEKAKGADHVRKHSGRKLGAIRTGFVLFFTLVITLFFGPSIRNHAFLAYKALLGNERPGYHGGKSISISAGPWEAAPVDAQRLSRDGWGVKCSTSRDVDHDCKFAFDGNLETYWQSADDSHHLVEIDLKQEFNVHSLAVATNFKANKIGGSVQKHRVEVAAEEGEWELVALGTWRDDYGEKFATFEPRSVRYIRLTILDTTKDKKYAIVAEINVYTAKDVEVPVANGGRWNVTLNFPLVPVTAFVNPITQHVITMASYSPDKYEVDKWNVTYSAIWEPETENIEQYLLAKTGHDMFCPGTSFDENGKALITGGSSPRVISEYDPAGDSYYTPLDSTTGQPTKLKFPRGYHGQTFLPSGKTFMIGGTWSGNIDGDELANRDGEVFDPTKNETVKLNNISADYIKMNVSVTCKGKGPPCVRRDWQQFHVWLFAWKKDTIFHAGPSEQMNWFFTEEPNGQVEPAGSRQDKEKNTRHGDAVCGVTSMYDAENGVILAAGGAPNYNYWFDPEETGPNAPHRLPAMNTAFEIQLGEVEPGQPAPVKQVDSMSYQRVFANAVILPNGETFVVGGQVFGEPFWDETWQSVPEIYSPDTKKWRKVARHSTPRVYHSWAMLLPDASVIVGGGGLDRWQTDHYDAQIYQPAYFFDSEGKTLAPRPAFKTIEGHKYAVGENITFTTDVPVDAASLIRYSATTHTVNNDLRRIKLTPVPVGDASDLKYTVHIPADSGVTLPGYWMLFVLAKGVPSHAETVQILGHVVSH